MIMDRENKPHPLVVFKQQLDARDSEIRAALPVQMQPERFKRVLLTAVQQDPKMLLLDRRSFFNACMKAAADGLLPDGREGAIVDQAGRATWIPMIAGIRKKVRNSGELTGWEVYCVYEGEEFDYAAGDNPYLKHKPNIDLEGGKLRAVYSIATLKDGYRSIDVMGRAAVERIRDRSQAWKAFTAKKIKSTPWQTDFDEMAKKTVARRHSKVLPQSSDLENLLHRTDPLFEEEPQRRLAVVPDDAGEPEPPAPRERRALGQRLESLVKPAPEPREEPEYDENTGEVLQDEVDLGDPDYSEVNGDPANEAPVADPHLEKLLEAARAAAAKGAKTLTLHLSKLKVPDYQKLGSYFDELRAEAKAADEQA
jgi:recombination protein RecT